MTAQQPSGEPDRAIFTERYTTALSDVRHLPPDDRKLKSLKVLAQVCGIQSSDHKQIAESLGLDDSRWIDAHGRTFSEWLGHHEAEAPSRCPQCGISRVAGSSKCPFCGGPLKQRSPPLVGMSDASQLRLKEVYSSPAKTALAMAIAGGLLVALGGLLAVLAIL